MNNPENPTARRAFGWLSVALFSVFVASLALGKFNVLTHAHLTLLPDVANFLLLFFATGSLVAYAAWPNHSAKEEDE